MIYSVMWRRGEGIRTPGILRSTVFKTAALSHSAIPPQSMLAQQVEACQGTLRSLGGESIRGSLVSPTRNGHGRR